MGGSAAWEANLYRINDQHRKRRLRSCIDSAVSAWCIQVALFSFIGHDVDVRREKASGQEAFSRSVPNSVTSINVTLVLHAARCLSRLAFGASAWKKAGLAAVWQAALVVAGKP